MNNTVISALAEIHTKSLKALTAPLSYLSRARLWLQILVAMALGIGTGVVLSPDFDIVATTTGLAIGNWLALPGHIFLAVIQMVVVPLILASIIRGIAGSTDIQQLKSTGAWLGIYFLLTTILAVVIGIGLGLLIRPGAYVDATSLLQQESAAPTKEVQQAQDYVSQKEELSLNALPQKLTEILPTNPMSSIVEGEMLQIVIFGIIFGVGILLLTRESAKPLLDLFASIQEVCMAIVGMVMRLAPIAVFGLLAQAMIKTGPSVLVGLGVYTGSVIVGMAVLLLVYFIIVGFLSNTPLKQFSTAIREPFLMAFSTNSSAATMPVTVKSADESLGIRPSISQFVIPIGATVNMGGTALYQGLATMFMAQMFGMDMPLSALVALVITALGASIGTPAVPGVGIIVLASVLNSAGVPLAGLTLIIGLDRILERFRASLNVTGDLAACSVMNRFIETPEKEAEVTPEN